MSHTPGPWEWWTSNSWWRLSSQSGIDGDVLCPVVANDGHPDLSFRNGGRDGPDARLIAAAPELLEACEEALGVFDSAPIQYSRDFVHVVGLLREAIAKAEGK